MHCKSYGVIFKKDYYHKHIKPDKHFLITREKQNVRFLKNKCFTTDYGNHLKTEDQTNIEEEHRNEIKMKCTLCDRSLSRKTWEKTSENC